MDEMILWCDIEEKLLEFRIIVCEALLERAIWTPEALAFLDKAKQSLDELMKLNKRVE